MNYSKEQIKAFTLSGKNLLVSASAGSGKTTVLVERIIHKLKTEHVDITDLLVVTFTEAAANEMKQRLRRKLNEELLKTNDPHLRKQLMLLPNASISTFHSFCNSVIQRFFYLVDALAKYNISDDVESYLLADEALETLFTGLYASGDEHFLLLADRYSAKGDDNLKTLIYSLSEKLRAFPFKEKFISESLAKYDFNRLSDWSLYPEFVTEIKSQIVSAQAKFKEARLLAEGIHHNYAEQYNDDMQTTDELLTAVNDYDTFRDLLNAFKLDTFSSKCDKDAPEPVKENIKKLRDEGKALISGLSKKYFMYREQTTVKFIKESKKTLEAFLDIANRFSLRFSAAKIEKGLLDFTDLEETALKILAFNSYDNEAAKFYKEQFKEIMIDEYQDTNGMQEAIISAVAKGNNVFMVGDVKQSIYRFRRADPEIFQKKYKQYGAGGKEAELINLNTNYRSRKEVLDFINFCFSQLMDEALFEIDYNEDALLRFGQTAYEKTDELFIHVAVLDKAALGTELSKTEKEAEYAAQKIAELVQNDPKIRYRDIYILSRTKGDQEVYNDVFKKHDIPFLAQEMSGYFNSVEVATVIAILKIVDNPLQDIPLLAVLRSGIFHFDEGDLLAINVHNKHLNTFYDKLIDYLVSGANETLKQKVANFQKTLSAWRQRAKNDPLSELLYGIYHETNFYDYVKGQPGGIERGANLDALYEKAKDYEELSANSLFRFINLIHFLVENDKDLEQARTVSDNEDAVRYITIHKSKGQEFPVVFLVGLNKKYNTEDEKNPLLIDKDDGIALSYMDTVNRVKYPTLYQSLIKAKLHRKMLAEELRLLYVAMTRAKERLYLIGSINDFEKEKLGLADLNRYDRLLLPDDVRTSGDYFSLLLAALSRTEPMNALTGGENRFFKDEPQFAIEVVSSLDLSSLSEQEENDYAIDFSRYAPEFKERLHFVYPDEELTVRFAKQTIADIKRAETDELVYTKGPLYLAVPKFMAGEKADATARGTATHIFMQHLKLKEEYDEAKLNELLNWLVMKEILTSDESALIDLHAVWQFTQQPLSKSLREAIEIDQELPFTTLVDSSRVYPEYSGHANIMVQGVMDLVVHLKDKIVLIDYKTDRIPNNEKAIVRVKEEYKIQIGIYKTVLGSIHPQIPVQAFLYLFSLNQFIEL